MTDKNKTHIAVVLDRSGSMASIQADMIGGFGAFMTAQRAEPGECAVSLYQFDDVYECVYSDRPISDVPPLELAPRGSTALLDAIGRTIVQVGAALQAKDEAERPGAVIIMIVTDGHENASKEFSHSAVTAAIKVQESQYNWRFMFLGADANALAEAKALGIQAAAQYVPNAQGVGEMYASTSHSVGAYRSAVARGVADANIEIDKNLSQTSEHKP